MDVKSLLFLFEEANFVCYLKPMDALKLRCALEIQVKKILLGRGRPRVEYKYVIPFVARRRVNNCLDMLLDALATDPYAHESYVLRFYTFGSDSRIVRDPKYVHFEDGGRSEVDWEVTTYSDVRTMLRMPQQNWPPHMYLVVKGIIVCTHWVNMFGRIYIHMYSAKSKHNEEGFRDMETTLRGLVRARYASMGLRAHVMTDLFELFSPMNQFSLTYPKVWASVHRFLVDEVQKYSIIYASYGVTAFHGVMANPSPLMPVVEPTTPPLFVIKTWGKRKKNLVK
jgi:hypothetical protein